MSRARPVRVLVGVAVAVVALLVVLLGAGVLGPSRAERAAGVDDLTGPDDAVGVVWSGESRFVTMGPGGWFSTSPKGDADVLMVHGLTGRQWSMPSFDSPDAITSDGRAISLLGGDVTIISEDGTRVEASARDLLVAFGDRRLVAGEDAVFVALSDEHVVVATCLSTDGARLDEEAPGGRTVVAAVGLDDGRVAWTHDTEVGCEVDVAGFRSMAQPEQRYVAIHPSETRTDVLDLATGATVAKLTDRTTGRVVVQGERAMRRDGDTVEVTSLRTGRTVATTTCPGARLGNPGDTQGRLSEDGVLSVECGDSVRLLDGSTFVTVDAPPVGKDQQVPDGGSVSHDRLVLTRTGDTLTVRDALTERDLGTVEVPEGMRIATNEPRGRALVFYESKESSWFTGNRLRTKVQVLDTRTGELVVSTDRGLSPGSSVSPDGFVAMSASVDSRSTTSRRSRYREDSVHSWVVSVREVSPSSVTAGRR